MITKTNNYFTASQNSMCDFIISRGIFALIIGTLFIAVPGIAIVAICILLGIFLLFNGLTALIKGVKSNTNRGLTLAYGFICLVAGLIILIHPIILEGFFVLIFALWVLISGLNQLVAAYTDKHNPASARILTAVTGLISVIFGIALLVYPNIGLRFIVILIGIYFVVYGIFAITIGSVINRTNKCVHPN